MTYRLRVLQFLFISIGFFLAVWAAFSIHPYGHQCDEQLHVEAAKYYLSHWVPPQLGAAVTAPSRSWFGVSYLDDFEVWYFLAGRIAAGFLPDSLPDFVAFRLLQLALFATLIVLLAHWRRHPSLVLMLATPQVWNIFTYCNGDAFPFFVGFLLTASSLELVHRPQERLNSAKFMGVYGLLLGLLSLSKKNYLSLVIYLIGVLIWVVIRAHPTNWKECLRRYLALPLSLLIVIYASAKLTDIAQNGLDKQTRIMELREQTAHVDFKPSAPLHPDAYLRTQGKGLFDVIDTRWSLRSFASMVGVYGWMSIYADIWYYQLALGLWLVICSMIVGASRLGLQKDGWGSFLPFFTVCIIALAVMASMYNSWVVDYQPQGRYLFPILHMLSFVSGLSDRLMKSPFYHAVVLCCVLLGLGSFYFVGLSTTP